MRSSIKPLIILSLALTLNTNVFSQKNTNQDEVENLVEKPKVQNYINDMISKLSDEIEGCEIVLTCIKGLFVV